jgi:hypothetical protein
VSGSAPPATWPFESRLFLVIGTFLIVTGLVYGWFATDQSGFVLLIGAGIFAWIVGWFVGRHQAATLADVERQEWGSSSDELPGDPLYLPAGSVWPAVMALGATMTAAGFTFGLWLGIPGVLALMLGVVGFVAEGRDRRG